MAPMRERNRWGRWRRRRRRDGDTKKKKKKRKWFLLRRRRRKRKEISGQESFSYPKKGTKIWNSHFTLILKYRILHSSLLTKICPRILQQKKRNNKSMKEIGIGLPHLCLCLPSTVFGRMITPQNFYHGNILSLKLSNLAINNLHSHHLRLKNVWRIWNILS